MCWGQQQRLGGARAHLVRLRVRAGVRVGARVRVRVRVANLALTLPLVEMVVPEVVVVVVAPRAILTMAIRPTYYGYTAYLLGTCGLMSLDDARDV